LQGKDLGWKEKKRKNHTGELDYNQKAGQQRVKPDIGREGGPKLYRKRRKEKKV